MGAWAGCLHKKGRGGLSLLEIWGCTCTGSCVLWLLLLWQLAHGKGRRWGRMVLSFRRKEGRVFSSCGGRGRCSWMQDCKLDNQGGEVIRRWGAGTFSLTKEGGG